MIEGMKVEVGGEKGTYDCPNDPLGSDGGSMKLSLRLAISDAIAREYDTSCKRGRFGLGV